MAHDPIFSSFSADDLLVLSRLLDYDGEAADGRIVNLSKMSESDQKAWLMSNYWRVEAELCRLGSWSLAGNKVYALVVKDCASKVGADTTPTDSTSEVERKIVEKIWHEAVSKMTPEQLVQVRIQVDEAAKSYSKSLGKEMTGFAALGAAQLSGFGIYLAGSTILGAINGALGLGLTFGAFTGLSSLIATVIGPMGWMTLGLVTVVKLGSPNYKKVIPAIIFIASRRAAMRYEEEDSINTVTSIVMRDPIRLPASFD